MSDAFISYRRKPSAPQASLLQEKLKNRHNIDAYLDVTRSDSTKVQFPERLMGAIEEAPTFILMLGDTSLESEWVLKEIQRAYELQKHCIPVFQESYAPTNSQDPAVEYVLNFDGVHLFDEKNIMIDESVANVARLIIRQTPAKPEPVSMIETRVKIAPKAGVLLGIMMVILVIIALIVLAVLNGVNQPTTPTPDPTHTPESVAVVTDELSLTASETVTTQPTNTATIELSPTPQTDISSILPEQLARTPVERNEDWTPYEREIDGVMMVLVPNGCFILGTENGGYEGRESPTSEICFDEPFWIDKYEVTKSQFESFNGQKSADYTYNDDNLPIEMITWFEARQFCESRNGRLPTEVQWEYAARGPNNWIYPWGNNFNPNNLVYAGTANIGVRRLYPAGSHEDGMSWVGAMDMADNVWEWVNSVYMPYPYSESSENPDMTSSSQREYVIRGGGWSSDDNRARSAFRGKWIPTYANYDVGFRCVRDFEG